MSASATSLQQLEANGAAAIVLPSLFVGQILRADPATPLRNKSTPPESEETSHHAATSGIHQSEDAFKALLTGADIVWVASTFIQQ